MGIDNTLYEITIGNPVNEIKLLSGDMNFDIIIIMAASHITSFVRILANVVKDNIDKKTCCTNALIVTINLGINFKNSNNL